MTLVGYGNPISMGGSTVGQSINLELGQSASTQISLNDSNARTLAGLTSSNSQISLFDFYNKSNIQSLRPKVATPFVGGGGGQSYVADVAFAIDAAGSATYATCYAFADGNQGSTSSITCSAFPSRTVAWTSARIYIGFSGSASGSGNYGATLYKNGGSTLMTAVSSGWTSITQGDYDSGLVVIFDCNCGENYSEDAYCYAFDVLVEGTP